MPQETFSLHKKLSPLSMPMPSEEIFSHYAEADGQEHRVDFFFEWGSAGAERSWARGQNGAPPSRQCTQLQEHMEKTLHRWRAIVAGARNVDYEYFSEVEAKQGHKKRQCGGKANTVVQETIFVSRQRTHCIQVNSGVQAVHSGYNSLGEWVRASSPFYVVGRKECNGM
ncbi:hypothetical protein BDV98DRAFT_66266 [Pterulicium gracile]|uniref:Uncharacterized protein n=1 Tax=Pterulicium gracile TaxID=1884261 RepID=A0A5C3QJH9_9AGAR|nr:hypothetical protein BDV98DRAFT_66266 [Pterula gracilis]